MKIVVQGSAYLDFTTLAIPKIVENMKTGKTSSPVVTAAIDSMENISETADSISKENNNSGALIEGFRRMETAVVELRTDLIRKVDQSAVNINENKENKKLDDILTLHTRR